MFCLGWGGLGSQALDLWPPRCASKCCQMHLYTMRQKPMQPNRCCTRWRSSTSCWIPVCELWYCLLPGKYAVVTNNKSLLCEMSEQIIFIHSHVVPKLYPVDFLFLWNTKGEVLESCSFEFRLNSSVFVWQKYFRKRPAWLLQSWLGVTRRTRSSYVRQERSVPWCKPCERGRFLLRSRPPQRSNL